MADDCIFCKIVRGEIPSDKFYQDDRVTAFRDINPLADTHVLVIPNQHFDSLSEAADDESDLLAHLMRTCVKVARDEGVAESGYRVVTNIGKEGGQDVFHLHFHVLGGRQMRSGLG